MTATQIRNRIKVLTQVIRETNDINGMMNAQLAINGLKAKLETLES